MRPETVRLAGWVITAVVAAIFDWRTRRIPNALTVPAIVIGVALWGLQSWRELGISVVCVIATLAAGLAFQLFGVVGGGDVKLLAAVAAFAGWLLFRETLIWIALFGGAVALIVLAWRGALLPLFRNIGRSMVLFVRFGLVEDPVEGEGHRIPYALVIAGGSLLSIAASQRGYHFL